MKNTTKPTPSIRTLTPSELSVVHGGGQRKAGGSQEMRTAGR